MRVQNKWNKKSYLVVNVSWDKVELQRDDGSRFEISKSEFNFSYVNKEKG